MPRRMALSPAEVDRVIAYLTVRQFGAFSAAQARARGVSAGQIYARARTGRFVELVHGVFRPANVPETIWCRLAALQIYGARELVFSHETAAWLWGLRRTEEPLRLCISARGRVWNPPAWVTQRNIQVPPTDRWTRHDFVCTTIERTLVDLASVLARKPLENAVDDALRQRHTTLSRIWAVATRLCTSGRAGSGLLRSVLKARDAWGTKIPGSDFEVAMMNFLKEEGFPAPERQHHLLDEKGRWVGLVDFAFPHLQLYLETDGQYWHGTREAQRVDSRRDQIAHLNGWRTLRIKWKELESPDDLVERLEAYGLRRTTNASARLRQQRPNGSAGLTSLSGAAPERQSARPSRDAPAQKKRPAS